MNPSPAEPGYTLPLQTVWIQIRWLLKIPADRNLAVQYVIYVSNLDQRTSLADNKKWAWHLSLFIFMGCFA